MENSTKIPNSYFALVRKRFFANRVGILGLVFVFLLVMLRRLLGIELRLLRFMIIEDKKSILIRLKHG